MIPRSGQIGTSKFSCFLGIPKVTKFVPKFRSRAPGERSQPVNIVEQRVTGFLLSFITGLFLLGSDLINNIPVSVLFGVFLYLGFAYLRGIQLLERTILFFIPVKYHPQQPYCLRVSIYKMLPVKIVIIEGFSTSTLFNYFPLASL